MLALLNIKVLYLYFTPYFTLAIWFWGKEDPSLPLTYSTLLRWFPTCNPVIMKDAFELDIPIYRQYHHLWLLQLLFYHSSFKTEPSCVKMAPTEWRRHILSETRKARYVSVVCIAGLIHLGTCIISSYQRQPVPPVICKQKPWLTLLPASINIKYLICHLSSFPPFSVK